MGWGLLPAKAEELAILCCGLACTYQSNAWPPVGGGELPGILGVSLS